MSFPNNKMKAITFSYDDGVEQDQRLINIFNKYNLKCTFNLNSGLQSGANQWERNGILIKRMNIAGLKELYQGHEIAIHSLTHPRLEQQSIETIRNEILQDKLNLEKIFGYSINGMAYPYGSYDARVLQVLKETGIKYSRTVQDTEDFKPQTNLLELKATCHHDNKNLMKLAEEFINADPTEPMLFYIWGHSYEFDLNNNWDMIENFCSLISNREDIFYGTNTEVLSYL
ncbi:MAG: polysaccharide deacetylase [Herbinix sp.]|jgi:peptidoglycan/xylan/chitin deacetylase (PgdA/CDA1 family)|nr:polysaccharide deacetylase [Herbinix sp.]